jgi:hypothetical protein
VIDAPGYFRLTASAIRVNSGEVNPLISWDSKLWTRTCTPEIQEGTTALRTGKAKMLITVAVVLCVLWVLGFVTSYTMGGFIHILLVIAVVVVLVRVIQGRRVLAD